MAVARKKVSIPTLEERVECLMAELEDALEALAAEQARRHAAGRDPAHDECPRVRRLSLPFLPRGYEGKPRFETGNKLSGGRPRGSRIGSQAAWSKMCSNFGTNALLRTAR